MSQHFVRTYSKYGSASMGGWMCHVDYAAAQQYSYTGRLFLAGGRGGVNDVIVYGFFRGVIALGPWMGVNIS